MLKILNTNGAKVIFSNWNKIKKLKFVKGTKVFIEILSLIKELKSVKGITFSFQI